ncbi:hypothetical protein E1B28_002023 [Marasmius oreades]|uniref:Uncharacterized protein n=1 Tax=Marasmius oreades TaxID=181124 RepID=A0A9P7V4K7_9AGAR|nr:uncharacterized protein E1B28_002023 [Marasmius oreades]KAG7100251.1 hypothetical protein E1B28_002023 [Marasmius oreades]
MLLVRFFALLFATLGLVSAASIAAPVEKRDPGSEFVAILQGLLGNLKTVQPQLVTLQQTGNATEAQVTPLVNEVTGALGTAGSQLMDLLNPFHGLGFKRRQAPVDVQGIINEIVAVIEAIVSILQSLITVQNIETLIMLVNQGLQLATTIIGFVGAILKLILA